MEPTTADLTLEQRDACDACSEYLRRLGVPCRGCGLNPNGPKQNKGQD